MDGRGARFLVTRIQSGVKPGDRVELMAPVGESLLKPGDRGVVTDVDEATVYVAWESGLTHPFPPAEARLRLLPSCF